MKIILDGASNMVRELFKDYNWPDLVDTAGFSFLENLNDNSVASCLTATFTNTDGSTFANNAAYADISNFKTRVANDRNTQDLYSSLASCMSGITFSRTEMSDYFTAFDLGNIADTDIEALMISVADNNFQNAQDAATAFEAQDDYTNVSLKTEQPFLTTSILTGFERLLELDASSSIGVQAVQQRNQQQPKHCWAAERLRHARLRVLRGWPLRLRKRAWSHGNRHHSLQRSHDDRRD